MIKNKEWTERQLKELQENCETYMTCRSTFVFDCYGGELLGLMMVLKVFTESKSAAPLLVTHINRLFEEYREDVIKKFPGVQLIDFDNPAKYLYLMMAAELLEEVPTLPTDLSELRKAIEQLIKEEL